MDKLTSDQKGELLDTFQELGVCPNFNSPEELKQWMIDYAKSQTKEPKMEMPSSSHFTSPGFESKPTPNTMVLHLPKIDRFAGGKTSGKNDISYDVWRFRVIQLINSDLYSDGVITQAVQHCLTGEAARVVVGLGEHAKVGDIIRKFDSIYGDLEKEEHILGEFYKTLQKDDEDVSTWGCRLEDLMNKAVKKGMIDPAVAYNKLRTRFWEGLRQELKDASGHKYDTIKDFDELRVEIREIEQNKKQRKEETQQGKKITTSKMAIKSENQSHQDFSQLASALQQLTTEVASIKTHLNVQQSKNQLHYPSWSLPPPQPSQPQRYGLQHQSCSTLPIHVTMQVKTFWTISRFTPIGVASLIASSIAQIKDIDTTFKSLGVFVGGYTLGIAIHQLLVIPVLWLIVMRTNPFKFLLTAFRPWITVFTPPSSAVGIPEVLNTCETKHGVDTRVSRFTVLFFASMSRMGSCYFICMASLFIANLEGGNLEAVQVILITVVSSVGALAIPSVPSASIITIIIVLSSLDISAVKVGMLMALEWYTDRLRTTSNTLNNVAGTIFIYKFCKRALEVLDMEKDKRPSHGLGVNGNVYEQTVDDDEENIMDQNRLNTTKL